MKKKITDWCVKARIVDGTWGAQPSDNSGPQSNGGRDADNGGGPLAAPSSSPPPQPRFPVMVMFFAPTPEALPQPRRGGGAGCEAAGCDIVRIHRAQVCDYVYQGQRGRNLVAKVGPAAGHPASYLLFDGRGDQDRDAAAASREDGLAGGAAEDATTPYRSSSRGFSWEPEAEPRMLEALRLLSSYLARQAREAEAAFAAAAAAGEEEGGGAAAAVAREEGAAAIAAPPPPPPLLMAPPPSAVRHLGRVLFGEAGSCDLGPVRVEAVEEERGGGAAAAGATVLWVFDGSDAPPLASALAVERAHSGEALRRPEPQSPPALPR